MMKATRVIALTVLLASTGGSAGLAQSAKDLVGAWTLVSAEAYGPDPKGLLIFDANGHFSSQFMKADLPKYASNSRTQGTPEEYKATVRISYRRQFVSELERGRAEANERHDNRRRTEVFATYPIGGWITRCDSMEARSLSSLAESLTDWPPTRTARPARPGEPWPVG
jgi:hypothetical protein